MDKKSTIKQVVIDLIIAAVIVGGISLVVKPTVVRGDSMDDTLHTGNYLIVNKLAYVKSPPKRGDIIVLESGIEGEKHLIKRVIGIGGDEIRTDGKNTFVNGEKIDEPYINTATKGCGKIRTWEVPYESVFVMGDNRDVSLDSREDEVGFVPFEDITGKVIVRLFPFSEIGNVK